MNTGKDEQLAQERREVLEQLEEWLETPMLVLGFVWLVLLLLELLWEASPFLQTVSDTIWIIFIIDFLVRFTLAPDKGTYLKQNVLTAISLLLPAVRILRITRFYRIFQATRATRGLRLVRVVSSLNRGMRALGATMGRRGFGYVTALTLIVMVVGAAGVYAFEREIPAGREGLPNYGAALWWTAMLMTSIGSEYWPKTGEGRILTFLLSVYSLGILGYLTATLATFFIGRDAESDEAEILGTATVEALRAEIAALRIEIRSLAAASNEPEST